MSARISKIIRRVRAAFDPGAEHPEFLRDLKREWAKTPAPERFRLRRLLERTIRDPKTHGKALLLRLERTHATTPLP